MRCIHNNTLGKVFQMETKDRVVKAEIPSHMMGLRPFTTYTIGVNIFPNDPEARFGIRRTLSFVEETGVQFGYEQVALRRYNMANPEEFKEYWDKRNRAKAALRAMFLHNSSKNK